jgi:hypothetical protein
MSLLMATELLRKYLLVAIAIGEGGTGALLLALPLIPARLLLGIEEVSTETGLVARILGAALLGIAVGCWLGRKDSPAQRGLIAGALVYGVAAALLLAYAALALQLAGIALWPAVTLHGALAVCCVACLGSARHAR